MFNSALVILYVKSQSLCVYKQGLGLLAKLELTEDLVEHLDIINQDLFSKTVAEFLIKLKLKGKEVGILLGDDCIFRKTFASITQQTQVTQTDIDAFLETVPLERTDILNNVIEVRGETNIFATSKIFINSIKTALSANNISINYTAPVCVVLPDPNNIIFDKDQFKEIKRQEEIIHRASFLGEQTQKKRPNPFVVGIFICVALAGIIYASEMYIIYANKHQALLKIRPILEQVTETSQSSQTPQTSETKETSPSVDVK